MELWNISQRDVYLILGISLGLIVFCIVMGISLVFGFFSATLFSTIFLSVRGYEGQHLLKMMIGGILACRGLYALILLIGANVSIWLASGVVPAMMAYGLEYMKDTNFLFATFLMISVISVFMGTAVGTISTVGLALLGIGKGFGLPIHILLGAIVSGAFIADKVSPLSGLLNLTLTTTDTSYRDVIKSSMITLLPTYTITAVIYYILGKVYRAKLDMDQLDYYGDAIGSGFNLSPLLLLLPMGVLLLSLFGIKIIPTISLGVLSGMVVSFIYQDMATSEILKALLFGYRGTTPSVELNHMLSSGGMASMVEVVLIVMGAIALNSLFEGTGLTTSLTYRILDKIKSKEQLIVKTGMLSGILTIMTCDQTVGIILPGRLMKDKFRDLGVEPSVLVRTISDTGTIIAPLMPWNVNGLIIMLISGVSAVDYAPYAVLCYIAPIVTFIFSCVPDKRPVWSRS